MVLQNEELQATNKRITQELEEEHERVGKLMDIITYDNEENLVLTRKLEEANRRLTEYAALESEKRGIPEDTNAKESIA
jgi:threonyl-tRNA synthetase